jgi:hypothetical protein
LKLNILDLPIDRRWLQVARTHSGQQLWKSVARVIVQDNLLRFSVGQALISPTSLIKAGGNRVPLIDISSDLWVMTAEVPR